MKQLLSHMTSRHLLHAFAMPLLFMALSFMIMCLHEPLYTHLRYAYAPIIDGEYWRIITAHFTHLSWNHFYFNMAGLAMIAVIFRFVATVGRWLLVVLALSIYCSLCFMWFDEQRHYYVGMSDVLHGVLVFFALLDFKHFKWGNGLLIASVVVKIAWEQSPLYTDTSATIIGGAVAVDSHPYFLLIL